MNSRLLHHKSDTTFFGAIYLLNTLKKSMAEIRDCNYYDTVDISHIARQNDSYKYDDLLIPANLTGEYDFKLVSQFPRQPVKKHLRGCVCNLRPCIRFCCPRKNMLEHGKCNDGLKEELSMVNPHLYVTLEDYSIDERYLTNFTLIRDQFGSCDEMLGVKEDEYMLFENGSLYLNDDDYLYGKEDYCFYPYQNISDFPNFVWLVFHNCSTTPHPAAREITITSMVFYILTISVYLYVKKLRNVLGKCLICSLLSSFIVDLGWILDESILLRDGCSTTGYSSYFFNIAFNLWLSVISYHIWNVFRSVNRNDPKYRFLVYSAFVWLTAAIPTGAIFWVNQVWERDPHKWNWMPLVGYSKCFVKYTSTEWIYLYGPLLILSTFNVIMFILIARHILKVKKQLKKFSNQQVSTANCLQWNVPSYLEFLRLSVVMGVSWIMNLISYLLWPDEFWQEVLLLFDYFHYSFGIVVFVLLILKRSTLTLLRDRFQVTFKKKVAQKAKETD
ncbi:probable G-protein coupled receptor Mth-like 7 isoform X2 [Drosophila gunungcola]|uniref:probable G-protein coupled receptor Mth-like 7 isoform X2 n=1 Tax=Drosophila gunungcola TaxID=103775 RepID=UPI0022E3CD18|nr:probable G-protein coupled receptor Mth-like 7 isoform X2 [Drosophila gunungcola]